MYYVICERCGTLHETISDEEAKHWKLTPEEIEDHMVIAPHYACPVCAYNEVLESQQRLRKIAMKQTLPTITKEERNNKHRVKAYARKKKSTDWYKDVERYYTEEV